MNREGISDTYTWPFSQTLSQPDCHNSEQVEHPPIIKAWAKYFLSALFLFQVCHSAWITSKHCSYDVKRGLTLHTNKLLLKKKWDTSETELNKEEAFKIPCHLTLIYHSSFLLLNLLIYLFFSYLVILDGLLLYFVCISTCIGLPLLVSIIFSFGFPWLDGKKTMILGSEHPLREMATHWNDVLARENPMDIRAWWTIVYGVPKRVEYLTCWLNLI